MALVDECERQHKRDAIVRRSAQRGHDDKNKSGNQSDTRDNKDNKYLEHQSTQKQATTTLSDGLKPLFLDHRQ